MANGAEGHPCASISSWNLPLACEPSFPTTFPLYPGPLCHQWTPNDVWCNRRKRLLHHLQFYGERSQESKQKINITEVILLLAPNCSMTNDPSNRRLLIVSCNKCGKIDSVEIFSIFLFSIFLVRLEMSFQEFLRDFSNTNSTEINGTFAPSCFPLSSLSLRYYFHRFVARLQMSAAFPNVQFHLVASYTAQILIQSRNLERLTPAAAVSHSKLPSSICLWGRNMPMLMRMKPPWYRQYTWITKIQSMTTGTSFPWSSPISWTAEN